MIQIKDVTKLYPAKAADGAAAGKSRENGAIHALDRHFSARRAGRMALHHGPVGVGQIDAGESDWLP